MRLDLAWLAEFADLPGDEELCQRLEMGGFEDVFVETTGPELRGVVVGHVRAREAHPNADRLSLCRVDAGGPEPLQVVCGAPNVATGQKVAFAPVGSVLPDGTVIARARIRGVASEGMICSARELGLGEERAGILVLDPAAEVGTPVADALGLRTRVLELGLTPNRGDAASVLGVAREVCALFGGAPRLPEIRVPESGAAAAASVAVRIEAPEACHLYVARVVRGVRPGPSPAWVQRRLAASGIRPIQGVVDVTNLVLLELGQPLHAFDLARLSGPEIRVRRAAPGEKLVSLDGETRELDPDDLVIADATSPVALAGVMGGAGSEVGADTVDVLIESAHFDPTAVRLAARRHGLHTEASFRFERGVDRDGIRRAADRAAQWMAELCGGRVAPGAVEARGAPPAATREVTLPLARANRLLGTSLGVDEAAALLARAGIPSRREPGDVLVGAIPSHRNDLHLPEDLVEEVARLHGYERIPATFPLAPLQPVEAPAAWTRAEAARDALAGAGLTESMSLPFLDPRDLDRLRLPEDDPRRRAPRVRNPVNEGEPLMRATLLPALLRLVRQNRSRQVDRVRAFEVGRLFFPGGEGALPLQPFALAAVVTLGEERGLWEPERPAPAFYQAKGIARTLMMRMGYAPRLQPGAAPPYLHPGACVAIGVAGRCVGFAGALHPEVAAAFEIEVPCAALEVELDALEGVEPQRPRYREVSRQPRVRRDLALLVDRAQPAGELVAAIEEVAGRDLAELSLFDRYEGRGVPEGRVSLAFRLAFQRSDRTLTDAEVGAAVDRIVEVLARRFDAKLRQ